VFVFLNYYNANIMYVNNIRYSFAIYFILFFSLYFISYYCKSQNTYTMANKIKGVSLTAIMTEAGVPTPKHPSTRNAIFAGAPTPYAAAIKEATQRLTARLNADIESALS